MIAEERGITEAEVAVLEWLLRNASVVGSLEHLVPTLRDLRVVERCECGCVSVDFVQHDPENLSKPIADAYGRTSSGLEMGLIVWGRMDAVTGLEAYEADLLSNRSLPDLGTLRRSDQAT